MRIIYDVVIFFYHVFIGTAAFFGNKKATLWITGRKNWEKNLREKINLQEKKCIWFHCASLGEFEQGRPLIEKLKKDDSTLFIVLTFFSPSGFELRKDYKEADIVCYLPQDTKRNAKTFIKIISPSCAIFVKYEFWLHYFEEIKRNKISLYIVSAKFRPSQVFFKWYGSFYKKFLENVTYFFVQDNNSATLLAEIGLTSVSVSGDTRFDRVYKVLNEKRELPVIENFQNHKRLLIAGSTWPEDEDVFLPAIEISELDDLKIIIAPHEISASRIEKLILKLKSYYSSDQIVKYSSPENISTAKIMIIDNIGILSTVYSYGTLAWIGGGFGKGIHNILEASVFGLPVLFGPNYEKFKEATDLIKLGGAFGVNDSSEATRILSEILKDKIKLEEISKISSEYVNSHIGATDKILSAIKFK